MNESTPPAGFPTTHWSRVARAGDPVALAELCAAYWYPIYRKLLWTSNGTSE